MAGFCESGLPVPLSNFRLTAQDGLSRCLAKFVLPSLVAGFPRAVRFADTGSVALAVYLVSPDFTSLGFRFLALLGHDLGPP